MSIATQVKTILAASDGSGSCRFDPPTQGFVLTGTISVTAAPGGALFTVTVGSVPVQTGLGSSPLGPIQSIANQAVAVVAMGLVPGQVYQVTWSADLENDTTAQTAVPAAASTTVTLSPQVSQIFQKSYTPSNPPPGSLTVTPVPGARSLIIEWAVDVAIGASEIAVIGNQSNIAYFGTTLSSGPLLQSWGWQTKVTTWFVPINTSIDQTYTVTGVFNLTSSTVGVLTVDCDNTPIARYRQDGRPVPIGQLVVNAILIGGGHSTIIVTNPTTRALIAWIHSSCFGSAAGTSTCNVSGTVNGAAVDLTVLPIAAVGTTVLTPPEGLLLDTNTTVNVDSGAGDTAAIIGYDLVAA